MAGLFCYIAKNGSNIPSENTMADVFKSMSYNFSQSKKQITFGDIILASVSRIGDSTEDNYSFNDKFMINCFCEGLFFIDNKIKDNIIDKYKIESKLPEIQYLSYLFIEFGEEVNKYLSGNYNIFFHLIKKNEIIIINDYLGTLPLFIYEDNEKIIYCSKLNSIVKILGKIEVDETSILEQLLFNYILSDNTLIKNIKTISNASIIKITQGNSCSRKYWGIEEFFNYEKISYKNSYEILNNSLKESCNKIFEYNAGKKAMSLTGGWDSRLVLSMIDQKYHKEIYTYSFGAENAPDIKIPQMISAQEGFSYTPYILDNRYLLNDFIKNASDTIVLSNGARSYKRSHYLYSIKEISKKNRLVITGIFGDQVLKNGKPKGNEVISQNAISLIENSFDNINIDSFNKELKNLVSDLNLKEEVIKELNRRISDIKIDFKGLKNNSEVYAKFRFEYNLRKYFGYEINSYNDFILTYSPFVEKNFVKNYFKTDYASHRYSFKHSTLRQKKQSTTLYAKLITKNYPKMAQYSSDRGYSMKQALSIEGSILIMIKRLVKKINGSNSIDAFNTSDTDELFFKYSGIEDISKTNYRKSSFMSIRYYLKNIEEML